MKVCHQCRIAQTNAFIVVKSQNTLFRRVPTAVQLGRGRCGQSSAQLTEVLRVDNTVVSAGGAGVVSWPMQARAMSLTSNRSLQLQQGMSAVRWRSLRCGRASRFHTQQCCCRRIKALEAYRQMLQSDTEPIDLFKAALLIAKHKYPLLVSLCTNRLHAPLLMRRDWDLQATSNPAAS